MGLEMGSEIVREQVEMEIETRTQNAVQAVHMQTTSFVVEKSRRTVLRPQPLLSTLLLLLMGTESFFTRKNVSLLENG